MKCLQTLCVVTDVLLASASRIRPHSHSAVHLSALPSPDTIFYSTQARVHTQRTCQCSGSAPKSEEAAELLWSPKQSPTQMIILCMLLCVQPVVVPFDMPIRGDPPRLLVFRFNLRVVQCDLCKHRLEGTPEVRSEPRLGI